MHETLLNSRTPTDSRAARLQFPFVRAGRRAVRPECFSAICVNLRELQVIRPQMTRMRVDGEVSLVGRWVSSSAFIREIRGKPGLSSVNAAPSARSVAECGGGQAVLTTRMNTMLNTDSCEKVPFESDGQATNKY